ncbi:hypothetical protein BRD00_03040 [Halobacteriales archaeon QS_8_69_26]|nr:MAG: hypothetical protein BRD00_03040 [Halobacteriales archaeon QS_8_69_26]
MNDKRSAFLAAERPDDVAIYLSDEAVDDPERLRSHGEPVAGGVVLVLDGERGRSVFQTATGVGAMAFAREAMDRDGRVRADLTGGDCPAAGEDDAAHAARIVFAFVERQQPDDDDRYGEGDVVHAYARCSCGEAYSDWWHAGDRDAE